MLKPSDFNSAVPKFTYGDYANNPLDPTNIQCIDMEEYNRGVEPLETLPAQWWNWICNQFTSRFNKLNTYVKNIFDELTQLLSLVDVTPSGTEGSITSGQLKDAFQNKYPNFLSKFIHTIASLWEFTGTNTVGTVTTTQTTRLAVFEKVNASDSSTNPATVTNTYNTKYVNCLPVKLGGTGACTKQNALANLTSDLTCPSPLPTTSNVIIENNGVIQKTPVSSIVSYAGTVSISNTSANADIPVALCTGSATVGKSNCCPLTYNPATGALIADKSIGICDCGTCGAQDIICKLVDIPTYNQWVLLHDITNWYNCSTSVPPQYMTGRFHLSRASGYIESSILDVVMAHSYGRASDPLQCNTNRQRFLYNIIPGIGTWSALKPVIICENATGKVYTALRKLYTDSATLSFSGSNYGNIIDCVVPGGGQGVTIPSGWTHLYEAPLGGMVSCAENATNVCGTYVNTSCVNATCCVCTSCVNASCCVCTSCVCASQHVYTPTVCATDVTACCICACDTVYGCCVKADCVCTEYSISTSCMYMAAVNSPLKCIVNKVLSFVETTQQCVAYNCICSILPNLVYRSLFPVQGFVCNLSFDSHTCNGIITCIGSIASNTCCEKLELYLGNSTNTLTISKTSTACIGYPIWLNIMTQK